ncbi:glycosyltransferase, partial [Myroides sp. LoEW2-1]|uniref:glycosyltransferase n=1 Tax=Myroides sp. LoEW2-1 TaxID=2683192 RepID=UPI001328EC06
VLQYATDILANSKYALNYFFCENRKDKRLKVIYNGINTTEFLFVKDRIELNISEDAIVVGHTGRFNSAKNHHTMMQVAERIIKENNNVYFLFCGKGVPEGLKDLAIKMDIVNNVFLFDNRDDITKVLNTIDIYFFPSITEGQPNALIEAWLKGKPFVASDIEPIKDIVPVEFLCHLTHHSDITQQVVLLSKLLYSFANEQDKYDRLAAYATKEFEASVRFEEFLEVIKK